LPVALGIMAGAGAVMLAVGLLWRVGRRRDDDD